MKSAMMIPIVVLVFLFSPASAGQVDEIISNSGLPGGLVVCVGAADAETVGGLGGGGDFVVQFLDADPANVRRARELLQAKGVYGKVTVSTFDGVRLPYVDGLVNLLIVPERGARVPEGEIQRVLAPLGMAHVGGKRIVKEWPRELDTWPHWLHGPDNNAVSRDTRVGISRSLQWIMPPAWGRHHNLLHSINAMVSDRGRIYYIIDEAPIGARSHGDRWALACRDAFNGLELWKRPMTDWGWSKWSALEVGGTMRFRGPDQIFRRLVAAGDTVYVTLGFQDPVVALDAATGETVREYEGTEDTATIQLKDGTLYLTKNVLGETPGKTIMAVDARSGAVLWQCRGPRGITPQGTELKRFTDAHLTIGEQHVFFLDRDDIVALDIGTGKETWRTARPAMKEGVFGHYAFNFKHFCTLVYHDGMVFLGQIHPDPRNLNQWQQKDMAIRALDASTGRKLWEHTGMSLAHFTPPDLMINRGLVWTLKKDEVSFVGLDVRTGEVKRTYPVKDMLVGHHHRCYRNKATANFYLAGEEGIEYIDFNTGALDVHHWMRGACAYGIMPANGLIYLPAHACGCHSNTKLNGFIALASGGNDVAAPVGVEDRLEKGAAYSKMPREEEGPSPGSWPVYKHDNRRSNAASSSLPDELTEHWTAKVGGKPTAPVIADGKVFLGAADRHEVCCLDAESGDVRWRFTADGRIDTPPTYARGRLWFGSRSGSVYSLTSDEGELVWRFRAAPAQRNLTANGQLESVWPVHGTVFVQSDKVYCTAGRSMHLDSGIFAYVLDADTGSVVQQARLQADTEPTGEVRGTVLAGILVGDADNVFMRNMRFNPDDIAEHALGKSTGYLLPNDGGLLDPTWYNSAFWKYRGVAGQMLAFDDRHVVGAAAYKKQVSQSYPHDVFTVGDGYRLFAVDLAGGEGGSAQPRRQTAAQGAKGKKKSGREGTAARIAWQETIPVRAEAVVLAGEKVCLAGPPDVADEKDPWAAFENRRGGRLMVISKSDGRKLAEHALSSAPAYDGMAAAEGRLFISMKDGSLVCFGGRGAGR